jgi:DNA-binding MarR family transcriptional regulator
VRRGAPLRRPVASRAGAAAEDAAVRVWVRLLAVHKRGLAAIRDDLEREMTMPRFDLLANLVRNDGQTLASLARSMLVTAGNLTGLVDRAARDGLVERRADLHDRRAWRVHITLKGQRAFREAARRHSARVSKILGSLSVDELGTLGRLLDRVRDRMRDTSYGEVGYPRAAGRTPRPSERTAARSRRRREPKPER